MSGRDFVLPKMGGVFVLGRFCPGDFVRGDFVQGGFCPGLGNKWVKWVTLELARTMWAFRCKSKKQIL